MTVLDFLLQHAALVVLVLASGLMLVWPEVQSLIAQEKSVTTLEATHLLNQRHALVIDLRREKDFALGHLPNARHYPTDELNAHAAELSQWKERPVLLVASAQSTGAARQILLKAGFVDVFVLRGGMTAWIEANLPIAHSSSPQ